MHRLFWDRRWAKQLSRAATREIERVSSVYAEFECGSRRAGRREPTNIVIGTLIPSQLSTPPAASSRSRQRSPYSQRIARTPQQNTLQGPAISHGLFHLRPVHLLRARIHHTYSPVCTHSAVAYESQISRCADRKCRFTLSSSLFPRPSIW